MDRNKAKRVIEVGLRVAKCCGTCQEFESGSQRGGWGTCRVFTYIHEKHKGERQLSVHRAHFCDDEHWTELGLSAPSEDRIAAEGFILKARWVAGEDS